MTDTFFTEEGGRYNYSSMLMYNVYSPNDFSNDS